MAADRHLEFSKFGILVMYPVLGRDLIFIFFILQNFPLITRHFAKRRFSIWRPSANLNLQNFSILLSSRPWKYNLHLHTKFR